MDKRLLTVVMAAILVALVIPTNLHENLVPTIGRISTIPIPDRPWILGLHFLLHSSYFHNFIAKYFLIDRN